MLAATSKRGRAGVGGRYNRCPDLERFAWRWAQWLSDAAMYHRHFGISGPPFQFTPAPNALYLSHTHREALAALEWGVLHEPTGFTLLVGESGVGKTTLICSILARRDPNLRIAFVNNPKLNFDQMMQVVMSQLAPGRGGQSKLELSEGFASLLDDLAPGERVTVIIDEAQDLSDDTLEELRLLSNSDITAERRLQIIFAGQPELMERLASPALHSLNQRIGARALLKPLQPAEVQEYIDYRLRAKGGSARKIFASGALNYLVAHSGGIPRRVNVLSHNSMLRGFAASSKKVNLAMVKGAVSEYEDLICTKATRRGDDAPARDARPRRRLVRATLAMTALALAAAGAMLVWSQARSAPNQMHATIGAAALRSVAERVMTGPGVPLRPVAAAPDVSSFNVVIEPSSSKVEALRAAHAKGDSPLAGHR
jgi:general secretion pathway protein A